jgi:hypothetical protein
LESDGVDFLGVAFLLEDAGAAFDVPKSPGLIVGCGAEQLAVWVEGDAANAAFVTSQD